MTSSQSILNELYRTAILAYFSNNSTSLTFAYS